jgi:dipeptidyl aminopeptidase/acylaminoacyl peptidase
MRPLPLLCLAVLGAFASAQDPQAPEAKATAKQPLLAKDYGQWESLRGSGTLSPDGKWLSYNVSRANGNNELRLADIAKNERVVFANATSARFTDDSLMLGYLIGVSPDKREKMEKEKKPVRTKFALRELASGETVTIDGVSAFAFSKDGKHVALQRFQKTGQKKGGADLVVRDLATGAEMCFGNIGSYEWSEEANLLAMIVDTEDKIGGSVTVLHADTGMLRVLDSHKARYTGLSWRDDATDVAFLRITDHKSEDDEQPSHVVIAWRGLGTNSAKKTVYDHREEPEFPAGMRVVSQSPSWHTNGEAVFFGIRPWDVKPAAKVKPDADDQKPEAVAKKADKETQSLRDSLKDPAGVDVWHAKDTRIIPQQKKQASRDRRKSHLCALWLDDNQFTRLGNQTMDSVSVLESGEVAIGRDTTRHERDAMFGPQRSDFYRINTRTGESRRILEKHKLFFGGSPDGNHVLYVEDNVWHAYDMRTNKTRALTKGAAGDFINDERGVLTDENAPYGIAGWSKDSKSVLLNSRFDVWDVQLNGGGWDRLTGGAENQIEYRLLDLDPDEDHIDKSKVLYMSMNGERSKKSGFAKFKLETITSSSKSSTLVSRTELCFTNSRTGSLQKAKYADVFAFSEQRVDDSPDIFIAGSELAEPRQVTKTNVQQDQFAWTPKSELINYESSRGAKLQGALYYPANYKPGEQYPMIVYIYEKRSQNLHSYTSPSERRPYNAAVFTSLGYFFYQPDIVYRAQNPGLSAIECVTPAVEAVLAKGDVNPDQVGLVGHSWGAYQTAFIVSRSNLFAAGVAGAPLTNMMSMSTNIYWNSGSTNARIFHESQGRMDKPFWQDVETYIANSPIFGMDTLETPLLIAFGDKDGAVDWHQGIEMYNAARLAEKQLVMLVYDGENHSLAKKPNQVDYHWRVREWFGHYVLGEPAPKWMTEGTSFLAREKALKEKKRLEKQAKKKPASKDKKPKKKAAKIVD